MRLDPKRVAEAAVRAADYRYQAAELESQARALVAKAEVVEHTWSLEPQDPAPEFSPEGACTCRAGSVGVVRDLDCPQHGGF